MLAYLILSSILLYSVLIKHVSCEPVQDLIQKQQLEPGVAEDFLSDIESQDDENLPTVSLVDVLSSNHNFSKFIISLQRSSLIDYTNNLANVTLLAPLNEAFGDADFLRLSLDDYKQLIIDVPLTSEDIEGVQIERTLFNKGSPFLDNYEVPILIDNRDGVFMVESAQVIDPNLIASTSDSVIHGLNSILNQKDSICGMLSRDYDNIPHNNDVKNFKQLMYTGDYCQRNEFSNLSVFLPIDDVLTFNHIEMEYLTSEEGDLDRRNFIMNYLSNGIIGGNLDDPLVQIETLNGNLFNISSRANGEQMVINNSSISIDANYLLSDGIVHTFSDLLFDRDSVWPLFTPRKYLYGLNQSEFVAELDLKKLGKLIDNSDIYQTIFIVADPDSIYTTYGQMKNGLQYHFANEKLNFDKDMLIDSKFCSSGSLGSCQKIKVTISDNNVVLNKDINIVSEKIEVGNTYLYFIDDALQIPPKLENSIPPAVKSSRSIQFLDYFNLLKFKFNQNMGYTVFLPVSEAWTKLDLTLDYLLDDLPKLEKVIKGMIFNGLLYDDFVGKAMLSNLNGVDLVLTRRVGDSFININHDVDLPFSFRDEILFRDGVAYPVDKVVFPDSLLITMQDLLETVDSAGFTEILKIVGLDNLIYDNNYSFIIPSTRSLLMENITASLSDPKFLMKFAKLHILPADSIDKVLNCEEEIPTLLNGTHLSCRELSSGDLMLQIVEGNDHEVRILRKGFTISGGSSSALLLIDKPINPEWMVRSNGPIHLHLPFVAVFIGVIIGMLLLSLILSCCFIYAMGKSHGLPIPDDPESSSLVDEHSPLSSNRETFYGSSAGITPSEIGNNHIFTEQYSEHAASKPIDLPRSTDTTL